MSRILIVYYSKTGNTARMADYIAEGVKKEKDVEVEVKAVKETKVDELLDTDAIILGSPTYYGSMAAEIKQFIDESVKFHGKLEGKIGGAFSSSGIIGGGNETTILDLLKALLVHGIIIQGTSKGDHYGPVAIGKPDDRSRKVCVDYGKRIAKLVIKTTHL
jgi:NAD(P)H dehydrogenase (quinone)